MTPTTFCHSCENVLTWAICGVFPPYLSPPYNLVDTPHFTVLKTKAFDTECPLCIMFEFLLRRESGTFLDQQGSFSLESKSHGDDKLLRLSSYMSNAQAASRGSICIRTDVYPNIEYNAFQYNFGWDETNPGLGRESVYNPSGPISTWSLASLNQVISWMSGCKDYHSDCNINTNSGLRLPKRLIDVDPDGCISAPPSSEAAFQQLSLASMPKVRVCETETLTDSLQYLTLSHRWDADPTILLTSDNLSQFLEEIPISSLNQSGSKTIRDAIFVTRCLGFRYLWIDAICINQKQTDDQGRETKDELLAELAIMDQIYANSTCNISATSAQSAADGLFFQPLGSRLVQALKHRREQPNTPLRLAITFHGDLVDFLDSSHLNTRGWVFQERMLSPRIIHFTNIQVYWECFIAQLSEHHERCFHSERLSRREIGRKHDLAISAKKPSSTGRTQRNLDTPRWNTLTHKFSKLSLSHPEDRLLAISALARHFQARRELTPKDYVAGHWVPDLWFTLHWRVADARGRQDTVYLAPSWSWASVGCHVEGPTLELPLNEFAEILSVSVVSENKDPFGKIKSGSIRLRCHISQAVLKVDGVVELGIVAGGKLLTTPQFRAFLDFAALDFFQKEIRGAVPLPDNGRVQFSGDGVFLALLCRSKGHFPNWTKDDLAGLWQAGWADSAEEFLADKPTGEYSGLILYPTSKEGQFVRVGSFSLEPDYKRKENTFALSGSEDEGHGPQKTGKIRGLDCDGTDTRARYEFDSDDDELFYGMSAEAAPIVRALLGRFRDGDQGSAGSLDASGRQDIEIV